MHFVLVPFQSNPHQPELRGTLTRELATLAITFESVDTSDLVWPRHAAQPRRRDNLWQSTCFECFIGCSNTNSYIEINASPCGDWQSYRFSDYRVDQQIANENSVNIRTNTTDHVTQTISMQVDIADPQFVTKQWQISLNTVLQNKDGTLHYYGFQHPATRPDFHRKEFRTLRLGPENNL